MLLDANLLLFADDELSPFHERARDWLTESLNGEARIGLPWHSSLAYLRLRTNPRIYRSPLSGPDACRRVRRWLAAPAAWVPAPTDRHADVLVRLIERYHLSGNAIPDAHLAALAIEHGLAIASADTDFARFEDVRWINPLRG
ncbi:MAG: PIN domain-containing protein [Geodermatophilaceae bacterium]|nr:PIN domain-containing protein [Geodermatophilaceae bacterium]